MKHIAMTKYQIRYNNSILTSIQKPKKLMAEQPIEFEESSGNIFADLGLAGVDDLAFKAGLIGSIMRYKKEAGISQTALAELVDIPQPRLSNLFRGKISGITTEKLINACARLGRADCDRGTSKGGCGWTGRTGVGLKVPAENYERKKSAKNAY